MATKLFIGNLSWDATAADLEQAFGEFGAITDATVITDRMSGRSRGFGFVELEDGAEAAIAAMDGKEFQGRELVVNEARPRD
jgi:RNA recognition motif-containing protein